MRFLADENWPRPSVLRLRAAGLDVEAVAEFAPGIKDTEVLAHARQREQVLLTFDRDFGELLYRRAEPAPTGVVFFRFIPAGPDEAAEVLLGLLELQSIQLIDRYTVVARERVRQRPLLRAD